MYISFIDIYSYVCIYLMIYLYIKKYYVSGEFKNIFPRATRLRKNIFT